MIKSCLAWFNINLRTSPVGFTCWRCTGVASIVLGCSFRGVTRFLPFWVCEVFGLVEGILVSLGGCITLI